MAARAAPPPPITWTHLTTTDTGPSPRAGHTLTATPSASQCLLFGGASHEDGYYGDVFILDLCTLTWDLLRPDLSESDALPPSRYEHVAAVVSPGGQGPQLLVMFGAGNEGLLNDVWAFDLATRRWSEWLTNGKVPSPRTVHSAGHVRTTVIVPSEDDTEHDGTVAVPASPTSYEKSRLYVFGGGVENDAATPDNAVHCLDVDSMFWIQVTSTSQDPAPPPRLGHTFTAIGSDIYLFGGLNGDVSYNDVWVFDTASRKWTSLVTSGEAPSPRSAHSATAIGTDLYIFGGFSSGGKPHVHGDTFIFDTVTKRWRKESTTGQVPRLDHDACAVVAEGSQRGSEPRALLVFGGMDFEGMNNQVHRLNL